MQIVQPLHRVSVWRLTGQQETWPVRRLGPANRLTVNNSSNKGDTLPSNTVTSTDLNLGGGGGTVANKHSGGGAGGGHCNNTNNFST